MHISKSQISRACADICPGDVRWGCCLTCGSVWRGRTPERALNCWPWRWSWRGGRRGRAPRGCGWAACGGPAPCTTSAAACSAGICTIRSLSAVETEGLKAAWNLTHLGLKVSTQTPVYRCSKQLNVQSLKAEPTHCPSAGERAVGQPHTGHLFSNKATDCCRQHGHIPQESCWVQAARPQWRWQ